MGKGIIALYKCMVYLPISHMPLRISQRLSREKKKRYLVPQSLEIVIDSDYLLQVNIAYFLSVVTKFTHAFSSLSKLAYLKHF